MAKTKIISILLAGAMFFPGCAAEQVLVTDAGSSSTASDATSDTTEDTEESEVEISESSETTPGHTCLLEKTATISMPPGDFTESSRMAYRS